MKTIKGASILMFGEGNRVAADLSDIAAKRGLPGMPDLAIVVLVMPVESARNLASKFGDAFDFAVEE